MLNLVTQRIFALVYDKLSVRMYEEWNYLFQSTSKPAPPEPRVDSGEEGEDQIDAPTHQAAVPKNVLKEEIIDVSYYCSINEAIGMQPIKLQ